MKKILILDNYDSFTYNLVHAVYDILGQEVDVIRNDALKLEDVDAYEYIIYSPGPGIPEEAGLMKAIIEKYKDEKKMLGVCLGHQAIFEVFGGELENLSKVFHGIQTKMFQTEIASPIFKNIEQDFMGGRYHSWVGDPKALPEDLLVTCKDQEGQIMALQHKTLPIYGVQFHPESILTPDGNTILENFLNLKP